MSEEQDNTPQLYLPHGIVQKSYTPYNAYNERNRSALLGAPSIYEGFVNPSSGAGTSATTHAAATGRPRSTTLALSWR